jgi:hypothetical protein
VQVLRRDAVGELVQICLSDIRPSRAFQEIHSRGIAPRHVLAEDGGAVGRPHAGGVEEVLDGETPASRRRQFGDEDVL